MGVQLTGADVSWLAEQTERDERGHLSNLHLEGANLDNAHLGGAYLVRARLERAYLRWAHLKVADTSLEETNLIRARLEKVSFDEAHLDRVNLSEARLESAYLDRASLEGANLLGAWLDNKTLLGKASLDKQTRLGDIQWGGAGAVNLTQIDWSRVPRLGDEVGVGWRANAERQEAVVRAYRQVSVQLRAQGMSEVADRFLYRSQKWQRRVLWRQGNLLGALFSLLLVLSPDRT
jgi:hypothetical protein